MRRLKGIAIAAVLAFGVSFGATACGSEEQPPATECFDTTQLNAEQTAKLNKYMADPANQTTIQTAANGVTDVCVIEQGSMHYYNRNDGLQNYMLYAMMAGRVHPLIGAGVIMGDLDPIQAMILTNLLVSPNASGYYYHPYQRTNGGYQPSTTVIKNYKVTNVYYGRSTKPVSYKKYLTSKSPAGYARPTFKPSDSTLRADKSGKVTTVKGVKAGDVINNGGKIPTYTGKNGSNKGTTTNKTTTNKTTTTYKQPSTSYKPGGFSYKGR